MRVLVTGATGLVGTALMKKLDDVVVLTRDPAKAGKKFPNAKIFKWDPMSGPPEAEAFDGVDAVVNLAGEPIADKAWSGKRKQLIRNSRVIGTRNLILGMVPLISRPRVLVTASATGWYGNRGNERLYESSDPGRGFLADVCKEWEEAGIQAVNLGIRVVRLRIGMIVSGQGGALERMVRQFENGFGFKLGSGRQWVPWIHIDDVVGLILHSINSPRMEGPVNAVAPRPKTNKEIARVLGLVLGRPARFRVPAPLLRIFLGQMSFVLTSSQLVIPSMAEAAGYVFKYPAIETAIRDAIQSIDKD